MCVQGHLINVGYLYRIRVGKKRASGIGIVWDGGAVRVDRTGSSLGGEIGNFGHFCDFQFLIYFLASLFFLSAVIGGILDCCAYYA